MEMGLIILPKERSQTLSGLDIKHQIKNIFKQLYNNLSADSFTFELNDKVVSMSYRLSTKTDNILFVKFTCNYTPTKAAKVLDAAVNLLIQGKHRKSWSIIISHDEASELHCNKLMQLFGKFERSTRELVYLTIVKIFGVEWYEKSFSQSLQNDLASKANKSTLVENVLIELTYQQLKEYLFVPFSNQSISNLLDVELSREKINTLSKDEIISIIGKCRKVSLWERFFSDYNQFHDFYNRIDKLQPHRNSVMHHKRIKRIEFEQIRKELSSVNRLLEEAILLMEDEMYTETKLKDVVSALGNMLKNVLGPSIPNWVDKMNPVLASFGKLAIEAAMPQINITQLMPALKLGADLTQRFHEVYQKPNSMLNAAKQMAEVQKMIVGPSLDNLKQETMFVLNNNLKILPTVERGNSAITALNALNFAINPMLNTSPYLSNLKEAIQNAEQCRSHLQLITCQPFLNDQLCEIAKLEHDNESYPNENEEADDEEEDQNIDTETK